MQDDKIHSMLSCLNSSQLHITKPLTHAFHISDTTATESRSGKKTYGVSQFGRGIVFIDDGGNRVDFEQTENSVFAF